MCSCCPSFSLLLGPWDVEYVSVVLFCCILDIMLCCVKKKKKIVDNKKRKCYESAWKRTCVYIVLMHGEEENLSGQRLFNDHSWRIVEKGWVSGSENLKKKKKSNSTYITTCCLGGLQQNWSSLIQKQTPAYSVIRHDWNFKWDWLLWSDETKKKKSF